MNQRILKNTIRRIIQFTLGTGSSQPMRNWYQYYFDRYKKARNRLRPKSLTGFRCPSVSGMVSIILPVFNGEKHLSEAIESILSQTYKDFELIIVNDGSTDSSPQIMERYAAQDSRIKVIHQENQKLPRSLSNGFRAARGQYLTWTSDDNRLKPKFLEMMVGCMKRHPEWDMIYANMDIIGERGEPLKNSEWYCNYQVPAGSEHIHLPEDTAELNVWPNQYIGAAFMYRDRVAAVLRDYSPWRFTIEDYDYFMQINEFFTVRHADFTEPVYDYRLHGGSLTSREKELQILKQREFLMVFDDFRRDFNLTPMLWIIDSAGEEGHEYSDNLEDLARRAGDLVKPPRDISRKMLPEMWFPCCYILFSNHFSQAVVPPDPDILPKNSIKVLVLLDEDNLPAEVRRDWDLCIRLGKNTRLKRTQLPFQGWFQAMSEKDIFLASEILCRKRQFNAIEEKIFLKEKPELDYSIVICTYNRTEILEKAIRCAAFQDFDQGRFEIIVVNNDPTTDLVPLLNRIRNEIPQTRKNILRLVVCPFKGLSHARNAGISEARGRVVCFLDDDAAAERNWLSNIHQAYTQEPRAGVVGGKILVQVPEAGQEWLKGASLAYWSHFDPQLEDITWTDNWWEFPWGANWTAKKQVLFEIGGFRCKYGRKGDDFGGGEELLAACLIHRLGYRIGIAPGAVVKHLVDSKRFTKEHVKNTIRSALLVNYRLQTDLYMPRWLGPSTAVQKTGSWAAGLANYLRTPPFKRMELRYNIMAHIALLKIMARDYKERLKT